MPAKWDSVIKNRLFFTKPADALVETGTAIPYPPLTEDLHHEIELVLAVGKGGANIAAEDALSHIWGAGVGIDFTRRDLQIAHREKVVPGTGVRRLTIQPLVSSCAAG